MGSCSGTGSVSWGSTWPSTPSARSPGGWSGSATWALWCVLPDFRFHSVRLLKALLAQDGYHFTDLSPSGNVVPLNARLKFRSLDTSTALVPNLPWPDLLAPNEDQRRPGCHREHARRGGAGTLPRPRASGRRASPRADPRQRLLLRDVPAGSRRKDLPVFAAILHVSNPELFRRAIRPLTRHLLVRHRVLATLAELRIVGHRPRLSVMLPSPRPKMYRSASLEPAQIDDLYSELVCVPW